MNNKCIRIFPLLVSLAFCFSCLAVAKSEKKPLYKDASLPISVRVADLMSYMTLKEKVAQMCQYVGPNHIRETQKNMGKKAIGSNDDAHGFYPGLSINDLYRLTEEGLVGSFLHVFTAKESNSLQRLAMKSRLQIPLLIGIDAIHGDALCSGATVYPTPIGQASSFDVTLVKKICEEAATEIRANGAHWTFTPNLDVARDARWGRVGETFGEDPYLVSCMGVASIKGLQGDGFQNSKNVIACAKHLLAGSEPSNGTNAAPMDVSERTLREVFLPPYKAAIQAGVFSIMAAHNELNGIPCHANKWLMTEIIRNEYGFKGFVVSDWMDVERIYDLHHAVPTMNDAYLESVDAGLDMHMHGPGFLDGIVALVNEGRLDISRIDKACEIILEAKFRLGLFEHPYTDEQKTKDVIYSDAHLNSARLMAEESIVLLKNDGLLPLDFSKYKRILVTGPNSNSHAILGDWTLKQPNNKVITILDGIRRVAGQDKVTFYDYGEDVKQIVPDKVKQASEIAAESDLAIVVVGENPLRYLPNKTCGENIDRMNLELLGSQNQLVKEIASKIPTIVILVGGRPLAINWISKNIPAILQAWEPGSMGGLAIANILSGKVNPSGKLPVSIPRSSGQIQMIYNHKPSQYFHKYIDGKSIPLYPFGYGLSYTKFEVGAPLLSNSVINNGESFRVKTLVKNIGTKQGTEVIQLYIRDVYSSATRPVKELKDFRRVTLNPGESKEVLFDISADKLAFYNKDMQYSVEKGTFDIMVGSSSLDKDLKKVSLEVR